MIARDETADRDGRHLRVTPSSMSADILICSGVWLNPLAAWQSIESAFPKNVNPARALLPENASLREVFESRVPPLKQ